MAALRLRAAAGTDAAGRRPVGTAQNDPETAARIEGLSRGLREAGWIENQTVHLDYRFSAGKLARMRAEAREVVDLLPDAIVVHSNPFVAALRQIDRTIPTVFVQVGDPVGSGFVDGLARPGGNMTGLGIVTLTKHDSNGNVRNACERRGFLR